MAIFRGTQDHDGRVIPAGSSVHKAVVKELDEMSVPEESNDIWLTFALHRLFVKLGLRPHLYEALGHRFFAVGELLIHPTLWTFFNWPAEQTGRVFVGTLESMHDQILVWEKSLGWKTPASFQDLFELRKLVGRGWQIEIFNYNFGAEAAHYAKRGFVIDRSA